MKNVSVVIPIYNSFDVALTCLQAVLAHTPPEIRVFVLDDASPEGNFESYCRSNLHRIPDAVVFHRNDQNLGFTKNVNQGFKQSQPDDVVILNSDAVVTSGWLEKLRLAAYSDLNVGTVTPLTNNGTVCSVPLFCQENELPDGYTIDSFAELIEAVSRRSYPTIPTCVGFCTFFRRTALDAVGPFDEVRFPRGYGEENDLSCRMQSRGFKDILADDTYVFHKGGASFGNEQATLSAQGEAEIRKSHPWYYPGVSRFVRENPLFPIQLAIHQALLSSADESSKGRILHILHNGPYQERSDPLGGTEFHVQRLMEGLPQYAHWSLVKDRGAYQLQAHMPTFSSSFHQLASNESSLKTILDPHFFDLIHVHHTRWFDQESLVDGCVAHGNYLVSIHDFVTICPRFHLFTVQGEHCSGRECLSACGYSDDFILRYRNAGKRLLSGAKETIAFSKSSIATLSEIFQEPVAAVIAQHGAVLEADETVTRGSASSEFNGEELVVVTLAPTGKHKGRHLFDELFKVKELPSGKRVRWKVIGDWQRGKGGSEEVLGPFKRTDLGVMLRDNARAHIGVMLSLVPETYGLAFDEMIYFGLPLVVGPLGAPAERVQEWGAGWVVNELTSQAVLRKLDSIVMNPTDLEAKSQAAQRSPVKLMSTEAQEFADFYQRNLKHHHQRVSVEQFSGRFVAGEPKSSAISRLTGRCLDSVITLLDSLGLKAPLQRFVQWSLGEGPVARLKNLRG